MPASAFTRAGGPALVSKLVAVERIVCAKIPTNLEPPASWEMVTAVDTKDDVLNATIPIILIT